MDMTKHERMVAVKRIATAGIGKTARTPSGLQLPGVDAGDERLAPLLADAGRTPADGRTVLVTRQAWSLAR